MPKYRSKAVIDAVQWDGSNIGEIQIFLKDVHFEMYVVEAGKFPKIPRQLVIHVSWGTIKMSEGDYVTKDEGGHISHNSEATFETFYSKVEA